MMYQYGYGESFMGYGLLGGVLMILFWAALIYLIVWIVRVAEHKNASHKKPTEYLKERYAKGEITKEEFDSVRKDILN